MGKRTKFYCAYCQRRIFQNEDEVYCEKTGWHLHVKCARRFIEWLESIFILRQYHV